MDMTPAEFLSASERLGLTREDVAAEFNLTPAIVKAWEQGTVSVPSSIARTLRWRAAAKEQRDILAASGLRECEEAAELGRRVSASEDDDEKIAGWEALASHMESCDTCRAREEYLKQHGPEMPELPMPALARVWLVLDAVVNLMPRGVRPPDGPAGFGRRMGVWFGTAFSLLAVVIATVFSISALARGGLHDWPTSVALPIAAIIPAYFIGFFVAGAAYDALRPIGHRFIGYVLRWGLGGAAVYGTIAVIMPFVDKTPLTWGDTLGFAGIMGAVWAVIGAILWIRDRFRGKLPKRSAA